MDTMRSNMQEMAFREAQLNVIGDKSEILQGTSTRFAQNSKNVHFTERIRGMQINFIIFICIAEVLAFFLFRDHFWTITGALALTSVIFFFLIQRYSAKLHQETYTEQYKAPDFV
jgi:hypothetical protein